MKLNGQVIYNGYGRVTAVTSGTLLTVSNPNETNHTFTAGEQVIVMQMQDDVIGTNTTNAITFGNLGSISSAGLYEVAQISAVNRSVGTVTSIALSSALANTYNTGTNSRLQVITFRNLNAAAFTTTAAITGLAWNGNVGGVIALRVGTDFTISHSITANGIGFRGGAASSNYYGGGTTCSTLTPVTSSTNSAAKGEGIYAVTSATQANGTAKVLNGGGGGGQDINGGGGGGGNYTSGGIGGNGWNGTAGGCSPSAAGFGGITLSVSISGSRVFMGGGGGGGQQNDGVGSAGANGGGIILIKANRIITGGCSSNPTITARGNNASNASNDGAGGGGAGGSIVLNVPTFSVVAGCPLTINGSGGNGGNSNTGDNHGGGGAGGQGVVIYSIPQPTTNVTTITNNGTAGCNNTACTGTAGAAGGTNSVGIVVNAPGVLPVELLYFTTNNSDSKVDLNWSTASEKNTDYFLIQRSTDGINWQSIDKEKAVGFSKVQQLYKGVDYNPPTGKVYYKLTIVDYDLSTKDSPIQFIERTSGESAFVLFPNPASNNVTLSLGQTINFSDVNIYDVLGRPQKLPVIEELGRKVVLDVSGLREGIYYIACTSNGNRTAFKLVLQR